MGNLKINPKWMKIMPMILGIMKIYKSIAMVKVMGIILILIRIIFYGQTASASEPASLAAATGQAAA